MSADEKECARWMVLRIEPGAAGTSSSHVHRHRALVHPSCGFSTGSMMVVRVEENDVEILCVVWANKDVAPGSVKLSESALVALGKGSNTAALASAVTVARPEMGAEASTVELSVSAESALTSAAAEYVKQCLVGNYVARSSLFFVPINGRRVRVEISNVVASSSEARVARISQRTRVVVGAAEATAKPGSSSLENSVPPPLPRVRLAGLEKELEEAGEILRLALSPHLVGGLKPPRGILLHGAPGTGKTMMAAEIAARLNARLVVVNGPEVLSRDAGATEAALEKIFEDAATSEGDGNALVFIDEIDSLCPSRNDASSVSKRVVATLLTILDGMGRERNRVAVVGATNRPDALDAALRRPGRLDREIAIPVPNAGARERILRAHLSAHPFHEVSDACVEKTAARAHGFVGADLMSVVKLAAWASYGRDDRAVIGDSDLIAAAAKVKPSALREVAVEVPSVRFEDIGGAEEAKRALREAVQWPISRPEVFTRLGIRPPRGVLLFGPPGCGKTLLAKAVATEAEMNFVAVKGPELLSQWVGESEKAVAAVFRRARLAAPTVIFFDELDALAPRRSSSGSGGGIDRVLSQLLTELDGVETRECVVVIAATNRPDLIDDALLRPGRFDRRIYLGPPNAAARRAILGLGMKKMPCADNVDLNALVMASEGFSGAEVAAACGNAAMRALEEDIDSSVVAQRHILASIRDVVPQITQEVVEFYAQF